jgi:hypothetical protein
MTSDSDYDGGSNFFLDEEKAKRARESGEYVWKFVVYVTVAYVTLFASLSETLDTLLRKKNGPA